MEKLNNELEKLIDGQEKTRIILASIEKEIEELLEEMYKEEVSNTAIIGSLLYKELRLVMTPKEAYKALALVRAAGEPLNLATTLTNAFVWMASPQGSDYWLGISSKVKGHNEQPGTAF